MSAEAVHSAGALARATTVEAAWAQWSALSSAAAPAGRRATAIIDPEALVLASLSVRGEERRLGDLLAAWARAGTSLLSVQRMVSLAAAFPEPVRAEVGRFAALAAGAGDRRWRKHAAPASPEDPPLRGKAFGTPRLREGPALMLRLRAGFGVGAKADLLCFLLGSHGDPAGLRRIALATGYSERALRTAAEEMALAGLIHPVPGAPPSWRAEHGPWARVLGGVRPAAQETAVPPWRFWPVLFGFLAHVSAWSRAAAEEGWSPYVAASRARDLIESHQGALHQAGIPVPAPEPVRGGASLDAFAAQVASVREWTLEHL